jgi:RNA polymerase sigma-70 factor (ECF subfamily)
MSEFSHEIIKQFFKGDEPSFKVIFNFFYPRIFHFVRAYIPKDDLAENLVQDTFLILWNNRTNLREDTNLNAWLYTVARNHCLKKLRDDKTRKNMFVSDSHSELELEMNIEALTSLDTSELTFTEIERIIEETLAGLSPQCRKIFEMSRFSDKRNKEIAEELNISVKAVEGQITKALKIFRINLKEYLPLIAWLFIG